MVKQMLIRVPDELHRRLALQARQDGRSINAVANALLAAGAAPSTEDRQTRLVARATALGLLADPAASAMEPDAGDGTALDSVGWGTVADELIADQRDLP